MHIVYELGYGGMELGVVKLANALDRLRIQSSICSCRPASSVKARLASDVPLFEFQRRAGNDPWLVARIAGLMRRERPDIVHTHAWGTLCEGLVAARLARVPAVVHGEHGTLNTTPRNVVVQKWAWGRVDQVLTVSSKLSERMSREIGFPLNRIRTIRNGVDLSRFHPRSKFEACRRLDLDTERVVIGTVGRLVPVKNQALLLDATAILVRRGLPVVTVLVGNGPLRHELESQAERLGIVPCVRFLGERADVEHVMAAFDVFALTSVSEGLSNTIQEAMATGLPVVATRVGGADELIDDGTTGLLIPSGDVEALASALASLITSGDRRTAIGLAGLARARAEFSLDRMLREYEEVYLRFGRQARPMPRPSDSPERPRVAQRDDGLHRAN